MMRPNGVDDEKLRCVPSPLVGEGQGGGELSEANRSRFANDIDDAIQIFQDLFIRE